jgi:hypothetical protein
MEKESRRRRQGFLENEKGGTYIPEICVAFGIVHHVGQHVTFYKICKAGWLALHHHSVFTAGHGLETSSFYAFLKFMPMGKC